MQSKEISQCFSNYYQQGGYIPIPSAPLLHPSIPMSFVMSAGLVQIETSLSNLKEVKGTSYVLVQKCFRYFDMAKVGYQDAHLSLFEMPGAFSFDESDKSIIIERMWTFVSKKLGVNPEQLWVTFFAGGNVAGHWLEADEETRQAWQKIGFPEDRLMGLGPQDNYWQQGGGIDGLQRYRKCGPNTEIFFDRGLDYSCGSHCRPGCKCGRFIEFANSLFIHVELDRVSNQLRPLARPFTETVIGTERLALILQNKSSVFDIDSISPIVKALRRFYQPERANTSTCTISENIMADHLRALIFLVADGAPPPGKNGRQRLMKLLIREILTQAILLNINFWDCFDTLMKVLTTLYDFAYTKELVLKTVKQYFHEEMRRFNRTLENGQRHLNKYLRENKGGTLSGQQIVRLEKQAGLPKELIKWHLEKQGLPFFNNEYQMALQHWRASSLAKI